MRRPVLLVSALLAVLCAAPAASHAATVLAHPKRLVGGPELAGTRLVLLTEKASRRFALTLSGGGGGGQATATVLRGRFASEALNRGVRTFDTLDFAGSASRLVVQRNVMKADDSPISSDEFSLASLGLAGQPRQTLYAPCTVPDASPENDSSPENAFAVHGDTVAYVDTCTNPDVVVRDLAAGTQRTFPRPAHDQLFSGVALSGRYVAISWAGAGQDLVQLYDLTTGAKVFEVAPPAVPATQITVSDSGTVWTSGFQMERTHCAAETLAWSTPAAPTPHVVSAQPCTDVLRAAGDRALFVAGAPGGKAIVSTGTGGDVTTVAPLGKVDPGDFDTDGTQAVYALRECSGASTVYSTPLAGPPPAAPGSAACPAHLAAAKRLPVRGRRVAVRVRCPKGCVGTLTLRQSRKKTLAARKALSYAAGRRAHRVHLQLTRKAARTVHRRGRLRAKVVAEITDRGGRPKPVTRRVTLRG